MGVPFSSISALQQPGTDVVEKGNQAYPKIQLTRSGCSSHRRISFMSSRTCERVKRFSETVVDSQSAGASSAISNGAVPLFNRTCVSCKLKESAFGPHTGAPRCRPRKVHNSIPYYLLHSSIHVRTAFWLTTGEAKGMTAASRSGQNDTAVDT